MYFFGLDGILIMLDTVFAVLNVRRRYSNPYGYVLSVALQALEIQMREKKTL